MGWGKALVPSMLVMVMLLMVVARAGSRAVFSPEDVANIVMFLRGHNAARSEVGLPNLHWDAPLAARALSLLHSQRENGTCPRMFSFGGPYGESIFWGPKDQSSSPAQALDSWLSSRQYYNYSANSCMDGQDCGEYTQIVWRDSKRLGCATTLCLDNSTLIICNYDPPGNYEGEKPY